MSLLKAIIFDMDGTLADTEEIHRQAFNLAFREFPFGWEWSPQQYRELLAISGGKERIRSYLKAGRAGADEHEVLWNLAASVHRRKSEIYRELLGNAGITLRCGVERLIAEARGNGISLGIATSSSRRNLETLLGNTLGTEAIDLFQAIVTCDLVEDKKPSPAAYQLALAEIGVPPAACIAIEDTRNGNLAALAAGVTPVITTHRYTVDNDFCGAALVVDQLGEPGRPFQVLAGDAYGAQFVDLALLQRVNAARRKRAHAPEWRNGALLAAK
ncbi:MAG: HAD-IA family hydrolase [Gammaproteobacteria bacterium]|nr:HAD-IA family hydrolase [Gammaproteobacteria bacterium]